MCWRVAVTDSCRITGAAKVVRGPQDSCWESLGSVRGTTELQPIGTSLDGGSQPSRFSNSPRATPNLVSMDCKSIPGSGRCIANLSFMRWQQDEKVARTRSLPHRTCASVQVSIAKRVPSLKDLLPGLLSQDHIGAAQVFHNRLHEAGGVGSAGRPGP